MGDVKETKVARFSDCQGNMQGGTRIACRLSPLPTGKNHVAWVSSRKSCGDITM